MGSNSSPTPFTKPPIARCRSWYGPSLHPRAYTDSVKNEVWVPVCSIQWASRTLFFCGLLIRGSDYRTTRCLGYAPASCSATIWFTVLLICMNRDIQECSSERKREVLLVPFLAAVLALLLPEEGWGFRPSRLSLLVFLLYCLAFFLGTRR